ncbi:hypothetical protein ACG7TL_006184 [Trametes sanguinea]
MSLLEPPTVTTRPPPSDTPDLPPSPPPSRLGRTADASAERTARSRDPSRATGCESEERPRVKSPSPVTSETREVSLPPQERDEEGRLRREKKGKAREPRWRELLKEWKLWLTLENSGSVARDHLASERTFLAYARTSLTIASTGVALVQLFTLSAATTHKDMERFARPLGAVMIILGLFTLAVGVVRYFMVQDALIRGVYPVARISTTVLSFVMVALIIVVFVIILIASELYGAGWLKILLDDAYRALVPNPLTYLQVAPQWMDGIVPPYAALRELHNLSSTRAVPTWWTDLHLVGMALPVPVLLDVSAFPTRESVQQALSELSTSLAAHLWDAVTRSNRLPVLQYRTLRAVPQTPTASDLKAVCMPRAYLYLPHRRQCEALALLLFSEHPLAVEQLRRTPPIPREWRRSLATRRLLAILPIQAVLDVLLASELSGPLPMVADYVADIFEIYMNTPPLVITTQAGYDMLPLTTAS